MTMPVVKKNNLPPVCACGCGRQVKWNNNAKAWNTYLNGHNGRKSRGDPPFCVCGCGSVVNWNTGTHKWNKYLSGHNTRDMWNDLDHRQNISAKVKKKWADPVYKQAVLARMAQTVRSRQSDPLRQKITSES